VTIDMMVKTLLDSAPLYVEIWEHKDGELRFMDCNERAVIVFGVESKQDVLDLTFVDKPEFQPDGRNSDEMIAATLNNVLETGYAKTEFTLMNAQGEEMPFEFTYSCISLEDKQIIVCYGYDLREAKERATAGAENLRVIADCFPLAMQIHDEKTVMLVECNIMAAKTFGFDNKAEYMHAYNSDFWGFAAEIQPCGTPSREKVPQTVAQVIAEGCVEFEWLHRTRTGEEILLNVTMTRIQLDESFVLVSYLQDLRPLKKAEAQRVEAEIAALEREKRFKENILATISHELRTPLAVMSVYAEMAVRQLKSGVVTEEALAALNTISDESHRLADLASSALDMFVKQEENETKAAVDIFKMAEQLVGILDSAATKRGVKIRSFVLKDLPLVWAVSGEITRVLWNIFDNAIKHTARGTIDVFAKTAAGKAVISVVDTGCGIPREKIARVFDRGFGEGSGLGLVFCKEIIESHGGEIQIESDIGVGTTVTFTIPLSREGKN